MKGGRSHFIVLSSTLLKNILGDINSVTISLWQKGLQNHQTNKIIKYNQSSNSLSLMNDVTLKNKRTYFFYIKYNGREIYSHGVINSRFKNLIKITKKFYVLERRSKLRLKVHSTIPSFIAFPNKFRDKLSLDVSELGNPLQIQKDVSYLNDLKNKYFFVTAYDLSTSGISFLAKVPQDLSKFYKSNFYLILDNKILAIKEINFSSSRYLKTYRKYKIILEFKNLDIKVDNYISRFINLSLRKNMYYHKTFEKIL